MPTEEEYRRLAAEAQTRLKGVPVQIAEVAQGHRKAKEAWEELREIRRMMEERPFSTAEESRAAWDSWKYHERALSEVAREKRNAWETEQQHREAARRARSMDSEEALAHVRRECEWIRGNHGNGLLDLSGAFVHSLQDALSGHEDPFHERLKERSARMQSLHAFAFQKPSPLYGADWDVGLGLIDAAREALNSDWETWKKAKQEAFIEYLRGRKRALWNRIEELQETFRKLERNILRNEVERDGARSSEYADRCQGWIDQDKERIDHFQEQYDAVKRQYNEVSERLRGLD